MYLILIPALACLPGWLIWNGLGRTGLSRPVRIVLTVLGTVLACVLIYCGMLYLAILLFLWNDRPSW